MHPHARIDDGRIGTLPINAPLQRKGQPWTIQTVRLAVYAKGGIGATERFAADLRASLKAYTAAHPRLPGDGLAVVDLVPGARRVAPKVERDWRGKPLHRVLPVSKLHRHSKRCLKPSGEILPAPTWFTCRALPGCSLHEHRTKRGRAFLVSHLQEAVCPFPGGRPAPIEVPA